MSVYDLAPLEYQDEYPQIRIDLANSTFEVSGRSICSNLWNGYQELQQQIVQHMAQGNDISLHFRFEYFNTSASKIIFDMLVAIENQRNISATKPHIVWHYHVENEDMQEAGEEFNDLVSLDFRFQCYE